jgi:hypothetical protein
MDDIGTVIENIHFDPIILPDLPSSLSILEGTTGYTGSNGDTGSKGEKGQDGDTGALGDTGATGTEGKQGDTGEQGTTGSPGESGNYGLGTFTLVKNKYNNNNISEIINSSTIQRVSGEYGLNSSIYTVESYNNLRLSFTVKGSAFIGLSTNPDNHTDSIMHGLLIESDTLTVYDKGVYAHSTMYNPTNVLQIQVDKTVRYFINGYNIYESPIYEEVSYHANFILI